MGKTIFGSAQTKGFMYALLTAIALFSNLFYIKAAGYQ
jgi:hypothetical protein